MRFSVRTEQKEKQEQELCACIFSGKEPANKCDWIVLFEHIFELPPTTRIHNNYIGPIVSKDYWYYILFVEMGHLNICNYKQYIYVWYLNNQRWQT